MLRARTGELENDVKDLIESSENLGHANPKQKLQYHMRYVLSLQAIKEVAYMPKTVVSELLRSCTSGLYSQLDWK